MDFQAIMNAMSDTARRGRTGYHLLLGGLRGALKGLPDDAPVTVDTGGGIGEEHSYRGYYDDLSFAPVESSTVAEVRKACERANAETYEGYKGGDFKYGDGTPLWLARWGDTGRAIIAAVPHDGGVRLITKDIA